MGTKRRIPSAPSGPSCASPPSPPLSPEDALASFKLPPEFGIELVAAEPLVGDPVAMQFDPDGRIWVVEMRGYMPNIEGTGEDKPVGQVVVLEDTNGDGRMDQSTVFLDNLVMPRAIALIDDGVVIAEPPRLWFCKDTDGDLKCDERTEIANDYATQNDPKHGMRSNPEHASNGLMWAMDNWIYSANHDVQFRYEGGEWMRQATHSRGQWGISQDNYGRIYYQFQQRPTQRRHSACGLLEEESAFVWSQGSRCPLGLQPGGMACAHQSWGQSRLPKQNTA